MRYQHHASRAALAAGALLGTLALGACDKLLESNAPALIEEASLQQPTNASVLLAGAIADFECSFSQYIITMGTVADEFSDSQANAATWDLDRRTNNPATGLYATGTCGGIGPIYTPVSIARYSTDNVLKLLEGWTDEQVPNRTALIARAAAYAGYAHILLGEGFCSSAVDQGPELTPAQVFALAEQRFTRAIEAATTVRNDSLRYMSLVGRARARINQGKRAEAAADAAIVPNGFVFNARTSASTGRSENRIFRVNNTNGTETVDVTFRGVTYGGVADPRVPVSDAGRGGSFPVVRLWSQGKYTSLTAPIPIATFREARLIQAEVAGGQTAVDIINELHRRVSLPVLTAADASNIAATVQEERRRELFLESHRLYDTIRFNVPLSPAPGAAFPNGGGQYGNQKCLPLPDVERLNNPNLRG
jgi:starch-binding outer membrane protein, SusD/RagB family